MKIDFKNVIIVISISIILLMRVFQPKSTDLKNYIRIGGTKYELLSKNIDTIYIDTTTYIKPYIPKPQPPIIVEIPINVDTLAILKDYHSKYIYNDTLKIDSIGFAYISDTITKNKIFSRFAKFDYKIPIIRKTTIVKQLPVNKVFFGVETGFNKINFINHFSANILLLTKQDKIYNLEFGAMNNQNKITPFVAGSIYWKINLKR